MELSGSSLEMSSKLWLEKSQASNGAHLVTIKISVFPTFVIVSHRKNCVRPRDLERARMHFRLKQPFCETVFGLIIRNVL